MRGLNHSKKKLTGVSLLNDLKGQLSKNFAEINCENRYSNATG
jgi:hypothetical protein